MELRKLNRWLKRVGLALVITVDVDGSNLRTPTSLRLESIRSYEARCRSGAIPPEITMKR